MAPAGAVSLAAAGRGGWDDCAVLRAIGGAGGAPLLGRLSALAGTAAPPAPNPNASGAQPALLPPPAGAALDADVVVLGGGLHLVAAQLLAQAGLRVLVVERQQEVAAHRAWNASGAEVEQLVAAGVVDAPALGRLVVARYRDGVCRWYRAGSTVVRGVLDCAVDAQALLDHSLARLRAHGGAVLAGHCAGAIAAGRHGVRVRVCGPKGATALTARVIVDARGVHSPWAEHDLVCPTVGGILEGLEPGEGDDQVDPMRGEILATCDDAEDGRQHVWEAFPAAAGQTAVYLFYYAPAGPTGPGALMPLYRRFFARLSGYKRGDAALITPTFGLIPGRSRLAPRRHRPPARVVLVGDARAAHSPLTFCGFGAMLRSLTSLAAVVRRRADGEEGRIGDLEPGRGEEALHAGTGALAWLMATLPGRPGADPRALNRLLGDAFACLRGMGEPSMQALLQDRMPARNLARFLWRTSRRRPEVWGQVAAALGPTRLARWGGGLARGCLR